MSQVYLKLAANQLETGDRIFVGGEPLRLTDVGFNDSGYRVILYFGDIGGSLELDCNQALTVYREVPDESDLIELMAKAEAHSEASSLNWPKDFAAQWRRENMKAALEAAKAAGWELTYHG